MHADWGVTECFSCNIAFVCVHLRIDSLSAIKNQPLAFSLIAVTFLMREEEMQENCTDKSGKTWVIFCDSFPAKPPTMLRTPWQPFRLWLMTSPIVGSCAYDLLIKFVFVPRKLFGLTAVTHSTNCVPSETVKHVYIWGKYINTFIYS